VEGKEVVKRSLKALLQEEKEKIYSGPLMIMADAVVERFAFWKLDILATAKTGSG